MDYDLVVIGAGPGGEKAAVAAAFFGKRVALIEKSDAGPGGAGVHTGTLPSKTLRETALYLTGFKRRELYQNVSFGVPVGHSADTLMCRLPQVRAMQSEQIMSSLEQHGVELIQGFGEFVSDHRVRVGERLLDTRYILIATGSSPRRPTQFDFNDPEVFDSDSILGLRRIPESLAVVGGGVIGSEYACVFSALGTQIKLIERYDRLLGFLDHEISDALMDAMRAQDIELCLSDEVASVVRVYDDLVLTLNSGKKLQVDKTLISAGRTGNTAGLGLDAVGVEVDARGRILVDARFRTNVANVYAVGDVIGHPALASAAMEQGRMAVADMFDEPTVDRDFADIPAGIYTIPEACACGPTEEQLRERGVPYVVGRSHMLHNARGQIIGDTDGFIKLIFHAESKKLLSTHIIAERATELIHIGQAVQRLGGGIDYFIQSVMSYPSLSVAYKYAAYDALGRMTGVTRLPPPPK